MAGIPDKARDPNWSDLRQAVERLADHEDEIVTVPIRRYEPGYPVTYNLRVEVVEGQADYDALVDILENLGCERVNPKPGGCRIDAVFRTCRAGDVEPTD